MLCQGPDLTENLINVLLRFRMGRIALSVDIEEMFMQVRVPEKDLSALRFLWWEDGDLEEEPVEFEMTAHPFGATSSPFCANYALRRTAMDFAEDYDEFTRLAVFENFYVDDCLVSFDSREVAEKFVEQCRHMLSRGGFRLRKWVSNDISMLHAIPDEDRASPLVDMEDSRDPVHGALGLKWNAADDAFEFRFDLPERPLTRRGILSAVSSFYDPLGLLSPLCLPPRLLLQRLCKSGLGWDQPLDEADKSTWNEWLRLVETVGVVSISRHLNSHDDSHLSAIELHVFADASESGYGSVAYAKYVLDGEKFRCSLLFGKSRVAPLKSVTVPRLELNSAVLAVRVSEWLKKGLPHVFCRTVFWTDSMIVLHYINDVTSRFATFVANRLSIIHQYTKPSQWNHVKSNDNLADLASRGIRTMAELNKWLTGPMVWPEPSTLAIADKQLNISELEYKRINAISAESSSRTGLYAVMDYHSDWSKLLRSVAWLVRFASYLRSGRQPPTHSCPRYITVAEMRYAKKMVVTAVQMEAFPEEIASLNAGSWRVKRRQSSLYKLNPVMIDGLLCVGGRLRNSPYPISMRHPVILPSKHRIVNLLVEYYHEQEGHRGVIHVLNAIRQSFWILRGTNAIKRVIGRCIKCRRLLAPNCEQMMSALPSCRVQIGSRAFESVGVDYFGPFMVKRGRSMEKRYGCIFTCLRVRAVHMEVAHSMSTDSFIMAVMRFIARRGKPKEVFSDNGTNFVGAVRELKEHVAAWNQTKINRHLTTMEIQWHFNPPAASHRGGIWERVIRSVKTILHAIVNQQVLTDETLLTFFGEAERILNNRPLVAPSSDAGDLDPLTPNHLLLMEQNVGIPDECTFRERFTRRWKQVNHLSGVFWSRWIKEYLPTLQLRQKWLKPHRNLESGDLVLVKSESLQREKWPLALVTRCQTDPDGLVRTVEVRTASGTARRDVRGVCLLEGAE